MAALTNLARARFKRVLAATLSYEGRPGSRESAIEKLMAVLFRLNLLSKFFHSI